MGSIAQVTVPAGLTVYFGWARRDLVGTALCLAWAGAATQEVGVYIADAPYQRLELIGGEHDWAFILGRLVSLDAADELATGVVVIAWFLVVAGIACCGWGLRPGGRPSTAVPPSSGHRPVDLLGRLTEVGSRRRSSCGGGPTHGAGVPGCTRRWQ
jgi:hypothetical protein